jgi:hypothetical protein
MSYASHRRFFPLIIAIVSLFTAASDSALARRAYSYGSGASSDGAHDKAITKEEVSAGVHKTSAPAKKVAAKKHSDSHLDSGNGDDDSILNVFAAAPMDAPPPKPKASHKTNEKSVVVARAKKID